MMKTADLKHALSADTLTLSKGVYTARWGFFYRHGTDAQSKAALVTRVLPDATVLEAEEVWKPFRGGASVAQGSHFLVRFRLA